MGHRPIAEYSLKPTQAPTGRNIFYVCNYNSFRIIFSTDIFKNLLQKKVLIADNMRGFKND